MPRGSTTTLLLLLQLGLLKRVPPQRAPEDLPAPGDGGGLEPSAFSIWSPRPDAEASQEIVSGTGRQGETDDEDEPKWGFSMQMISPNDGRLILSKSGSDCPD